MPELTMFLHVELELIRVPVLRMIFIYAAVVREIDLLFLAASVHLPETQPMDLGWTCWLKSLPGVKA